MLHMGAGNSQRETCDDSSVIHSSPGALLHVMGFDIFI